MNLKNSVKGFVGANLFARSASYVRMNSHLQKRHNPLKDLNILRQQGNIGWKVKPHTAFDDKTPDEFYFDNLPALPKAA